MVRITGQHKGGGLSVKSIWWTVFHLCLPGELERTQISKCLLMNHSEFTLIAGSGYGHAGKWTGKQNSPFRNE